MSRLPLSGQIGQERLHPDFVSFIGRMDFVRHEPAGNPAGRVGVEVVTGDTKVVERGKGDGIYINTSGIGFVRIPGLSPGNIRAGISDGG